MNGKQYILVVLILVIGASLICQTAAIAGDRYGSNLDPGHGGWKIPKQKAPTPVPEPASMVLLGSGIAGLLGWRKSRKN